MVRVLKQVTHISNYARTIALQFTVEKLRKLNCISNVSKYNIDKTAGVCYGFHTTVCVYSQILHEMGNNAFIAVTVLHCGVFVLDLSSDELYC